MKNGIFFNGRPWSYEATPHIKWSHCIIAGQLTRDAEEKCWSKPKIKICIKYHRGAFLNCYIYKGESKDDLRFYELAKSLQEGDYVFGVGIYKEQTYINKTHETKIAYEAELEFLIPFAALLNPRAYMDIMTAIGESADEPTAYKGVKGAEDEFESDDREGDTDGDPITTF